MEQALRPLGAAGRAAAALHVDGDGARAGRLHVHAQAVHALEGGRLEDGVDGVHDVVPLPQVLHVGGGAPGPRLRAEGTRGLAPRLGLGLQLRQLEVHDLGGGEERKKERKKERERERESAGGEGQFE